MSEPLRRPRASVVIPSYNHGRFIEACIDSVLAPALDPAELEVVVVDDGSTDDSRDRLARLTGEPRLRVFQQENRGAHAALNRGLELARGDVLFILNSDDLFEPERIPRLLELFARDPGVSVAVTWLQVIDGSGETLAIKEGWRNLPPWPRPGSGPGFADLGEPALALLESNYVATTSNVAFRRRLFSERSVRFSPLRYTHDWDFLLAATAHGELALVEEPLVRYRVHSANTIGEGRDERIGWMRFEILWTVARHLDAVCRRYAEGGHDVDDLRARLASSAPRFGCLDLLAELCVLRGTGGETPASYLALLQEGHPFRRRAIHRLGQGG